MPRRQNTLSEGPSSFRTDVTLDLGGQSQDYNGRVMSNATNSPEQKSDAPSKSRFDVRRLSMRPSGEYQTEGHAVNVTRTLSLSRKEWEALLAKPDLVLQHKHDAQNFSESSVSLASHKGYDFRKFRSIFGLPILHPHGRFVVLWHGLMLFLDLTYTAFVVPIGVGFNISDTSWTWGAVCDFFAGLVFVVDFVLGFHTGYVISYNVRKKVVMDGKQVAKWYITRGSCIVDFFSTVAWLTQVILILLKIGGQDDYSVASQIQILRILRLARLGRLFTSIFMSATGGGIVSLIFKDAKMNSTVLYFSQLLYSIAVLINFLGCFWYWVADREGIEDTWITAFAPYIIKYGDDGSLDATMVRARISKPNLYMTSVYWALMTVSTIGYGDITAQTVAEEGVSLFVFLLGIIFFGILIGTLTQLLQTASRDARKAQSFREKMNSVDDWIKRRHFPSNLRRKIREHYWAFWLRQADEADEAQLLQELPHTLRHEALWSMSKRSLAVLPSFSDLPKELQFLLASHIRPKKIPPGTDIITQGASASKMYLLDYGKVVPVHHDVTGDPRSEPCMFNADGLLQEMHPKFQKNSRGFRSLTPCGLWEWGIAAFLGVCKHHPGVYEHVCQQVLVKLKEALQTEPEFFPQGYDLLLQEVEKILDVRLQKLSMSTDHNDQPNANHMYQTISFGETPRHINLDQKNFPLSTMVSEGEPLRIYNEGPRPPESAFNGPVQGSQETLGQNLRKASTGQSIQASLSSQDPMEEEEAKEEEGEAELEGNNDPSSAGIVSSLADINDQLAQIRSLILDSRD